MPLVVRAVINALRSVPITKYLNRSGWIGKSARGLGRTVTYGVSIAAAYYDFADDYGVGAATVYGIAAGHPITGIPFTLLEFGAWIGDSAYELQQAKHQSSFVKSPMMFAKIRANDRFDKINMMRQYAGQQMRKDHSSAQRVLGNEAVYLHR